MSKEILLALWKSKGPKGINILSWILMYSSVNTADVLQKKMDSFWLQLSVCFLCCSNGESFNHLFSDCNFSLAGLVCSEFSICIGVFPFNFQGQCSSAHVCPSGKDGLFLFSAFCLSSCLQLSVCLLSGSNGESLNHLL